MSLSKFSQKQNPMYKFRFFHPCGKCGSHCDSDESLILYCEVCRKHFHRSCLKISKRRYSEIHRKKETFVCSPKCSNTLMALSEVDNIDFFSALSGEGKYPCGRCCRDCLDETPCISCSICDRWFHFECSNLSAKEFNSIDYYFCSPACEICLLPFTEVATSNLIKEGILCDGGVTKNPSKKKKKKLKRSMLKTKHFLSSQSVKIDHFLEIDCAYLDTNEVNNFLNSDHSFTIFQNNLRSMNLNLHLIDEIFLDCEKKPDILAFSETRLRHNDASPYQKGYHELEREDSPTEIGGVGFYVSENIQYSRRDDLSLKMDRVEDLWVEIEIPKSSTANTKSSTEKYVIGNIYRHPGSQYKYFCERLCNTLEILHKSKTKYILVGDYNISALKYNLCTDVTNYINSLNSVGCHIHVDKPTRIAENTASCIDHVYSNLTPDRLTNRIVLSDASDHFSVITKVPDVNSYNEKSKLYYRRSKLSSSEWENFNSELKQILDQKLNCNALISLDPNSYAEHITNTYHALIEKFMPVKTLSRKQRRFFDKPWITKGLKISIRTKNKMFQLLKKTSDLAANQKYKDYRSLLTRLKIKAKNKYYYELAVSYGNDKSKTWRLINEIMNRRRKSKKSVNSIIDTHGRKIQDPKIIANSLNEHFSTVGKVMASKFSSNTNQKNPLDYVSADIKNLLIFSPTTQSEISKLIRKLNIKKSCGYDSISNKILKFSSSVITPFIVKLFNECIKNGIFPDCFKTAQVVPLFKGGEREDRTCYRPISLLPAVGKLLEKVISVRTTKFLQKNNAFSNHQFGFREGFSTEYAILDIYEKLLCNLDKGLSSCAIFLDLAKAFDSVDHGVLLSKLPKYGIRGKSFEFFKSYLTSRTQFVKLGGVSSSLLPIDFGVPQGSILGPLLFIIFINDLQNATNLFIKLFADDTFLCAENSNFDLLEREVNLELEKVYEWLSANKLTLNISKSKYMLVTNKKDITRNPSISIDGTLLESCEKYKYLGVVIDKNLTWKPQIEHVCKKISKACGAIAKLRHCMSTKLLVEVYHSLIHSYLRYGIMVWGTASDVNLHPLKVLVNRAVRIITSAPFGRVDLDPIYSYLRVLDLEKVYSLETCKYMYKVKKDLIPVVIGKHFRNRSEILPKHNYNLRNRNQAPKIETRLTSSEKSIQLRGEKLWADLPDNLKECSSLVNFKKNMKLSLLESYVD